MNGDEHSPSIFGQSGISMVSIILIVVLLLQIFLAYWTLSGDTSSTVESLAVIYVIFMLLFGYTTGRLRTELFLSILFGGWLFFITISYIYGPSTKYAILAIITGIGTIYYSVMAIK